MSSMLETKRRGPRSEGTLQSTGMLDVLLSYITYFRESFAPSASSPWKGSEKLSRENWTLKSENWQIDVQKSSSLDR